MGRIPIFDSEASVGSNGLGVDHALAQDSWVISRPVRLTGGPAGDQRNISYEFVLSGLSLTDWAIEWYQSFWGDTPWVNLVSAVGLPQAMRQGVPIGAFPDERVFPGSAAAYPWAREQIAVAGIGGIIAHYNILRQVTMTVPALGGADCRWYPMLVHGYWTRLHIRTTTVTADVVVPRLRVFAHVGGSTDIAEYTERIAEPFDWFIPELP